MAGIRNIVPFLRLGEMRGSNRRQGGRVHTSGLTSNRGVVIDLSQLGARLQTRLAWREGETRTIMLRGADLSVRALARCVWVRRDGFMKHVVGLSFEQLSNETTFGLQELVRTYGARTEMREAA